MIQNLQTSNKSASQNNNQRQHQKTFRIFEREKSSWGWSFPKRKHVILTSYCVPVSHKYLTHAHNHINPAEREKPII